MSRRVGVILLLSALVAAPASALRALCAGRTCERPAHAEARVPFCSLPHDIRGAIADGFRENRSPEVLAVARSPRVAGGSTLSGSIRPPWPSLSSVRGDEVPVVFFGPRISAVRLPETFGLDDLAPTLADIIGLRRPHPNVRSGQAVTGLWRGAPPRLVVEVALKGVGSAEISEPEGQWRYLPAIARRGAATFVAAVGSLPLDPAAILTTVGTGGLPRQHGITGTLVRNDYGRLVRAWSRKAPVSVIASFADDLDERNGQRPRVGLVATSPSDRGIIGGDWYLDGDHDTVVVARRHAATAAEHMLRAGYGDDADTDLLAVVARGSAERLDRMLRRLATGARRASNGSFVLAVTATGDALGQDEAIPAQAVVTHVERSLPGPRGVVEAAAAGGLFVDQDVVARRSLAEDELLSALASMRSRGEPVFADRFGGIAVSFGRYC
jgi:hypothetical protein